MPTWVATSELGGRHAHRTSTPPAAAYNASTSGHILVDRHLEKNGGTAFRDVLKEAQLNGLCMYWGFQLRSVIWSQVLDRLPSLDTPLRLCIEAHSGIDYGTSWLDRLARLRAVAAGWAARGAPNRLTTTVRMRNPLSHYISFFLWTRVERQARAPERHGRDFAEWVRATPNLQAELLLSSKAAFTASFAALDHAEVTAWKARWADANASAARAAAAHAALGAYDVVGTTERFDESTLHVARRIGWSVNDAVVRWRATHAVQPAETCIKHPPGRPGAPWWCRDPRLPPKKEKARVHARVCPDRKACEEMVRQVAPVDYELYARATKALDAAAADGGAPFAAELRQMKQLRAAPPQPPRCHWTHLQPPVVANQRLERDGRKRVLAAAPAFNASDSCWRGDQEVLRLVWAEMREGGRAAFGAPFTRLVHGRPKVSARQRRRGFGADVGPRWREGSANWTAADRAMAGRVDRAIMAGRGGRGGRGGGRGRGGRGPTLIKIDRGGRGGRGGANPYEAGGEGRRGPKGQRSRS